MPDPAPATRRATAPDNEHDPVDDPGQPCVAEVIQRYETRDRAAYYAELRAAVTADRREAATREATDETDVKAVDGCAQQEVCWPGTGRTGDPVMRRGHDGRALDAAVDAEVHQGCEHIREAERTVITPAIRDIEAADARRELVGLDHRLKGDGRLKEKVARALDEQPEMTPSQALLSVPDAIRFTFCYSENRYPACVRADLERLHARGFELVKPLRNSWDSDQYKGINTQWREPETMQRFEVQFHTSASFETKQLTHAAYEWLRDPATPHAERGDLIGFHQQACARPVIPPGATEIHDNPRETR
jgi:hypothetical protein